MNVKDIYIKITDIEYQANHERDDEKAHLLEDALLWEFVDYIAKSDSSNSDLAREVQKSRRIKFARWCT